MWCVCVLINHTTTTVVSSMPIILLTVLQEMVVVNINKITTNKKKSIFLKIYHLIGLALKKVLYRVVYYLITSPVHTYTYSTKAER